MPRYPFMTRRKGSKNLYYKRPIPKALQTPDRGKQIWRSLGTDDEQIAKLAYRKNDQDIDELFEQWRRNDTLPTEKPDLEQQLNKSTLTPLTPALLKRLADEHYVHVYENDFEWRGKLWHRAHEDEDAFWQGGIIELPRNDWIESGNPSRSYFARLMEEPVLEEVFLYTIFSARKVRLNELRRHYQLGDRSGHQAAAERVLASKALLLSQSDRGRLERKLMETEIRALEDITAGDERAFDIVVERQSATEPAAQPSTKPAAPLLSAIVEKYLDDTAREREWPKKTTLRKRGELREFVEIVGDKPINGYTRDDGILFKDTQLALPAQRNTPAFKGLRLTDVAIKTSQLRAAGSSIELLSPITINDKIGTISLFFVWLGARYSSVLNPLADQAIKRRKNSRKGKTRHPWTINELNLLFAAPTYTGCQSEYHWQRPGPDVLRESAKFWVPLIALFSGMRLGEIIQMSVNDVKTADDILYFDVTPVPHVDDEEADDVDEANEKSLKTVSSRRGIPVHLTLVEIGFADFLAMRRSSSGARLFPDYGQAKDDGSWSKQFSKHFKRFRHSIGVTRRGVKFHSLRHNVEDALRNADVRKEVRDAIQGHGESGVSREYGTGYYVKTLNAAIQQIAYKGLKIDHLTPS